MSIRSGSRARGGPDETSGWRRTGRAVAELDKTTAQLVERPSESVTSSQAVPLVGTYSWSRATVLASSGDHGSRGAEHGGEGVE